MELFTLYLLGCVQMLFIMLYTELSDSEEYGFFDYFMILFCCALWPVFVGIVAVVVSETTNLRNIQFHLTSRRSNNHGHGSLGGNFVAYF